MGFPFNTISVILLSMEIFFGCLYRFESVNFLKTCALSYNGSLQKPRIGLILSTVSRFTCFSIAVDTELSKITILF